MRAEEIDCRFQRRVWTEKVIESTAEGRLQDQGRKQMPVLPSSRGTLTASLPKELGQGRAENTSQTLPAVGGVGHTEENPDTK